MILCQSPSASLRPLHGATGALTMTEFHWVGGRLSNSEMHGCDKITCAMLEAFLCRSLSFAPVYRRQWQPASWNSENYERNPSRLLAEATLTSVEVVCSHIGIMYFCEIVVWGPVNSAQCLHRVGQKIRDQMSNISGEKPRRFQKQKPTTIITMVRIVRITIAISAPRIMCEKGRYQALLLNSSWALESKASLQLQSWIERDRVVFRNEGQKHRCQHAVSLLWGSPQKRPPSVGEPS